MRKKFPRDLTGLTFGRLTVLELYDKKSTRWICECECGEIKIVYRSNLTTGQSTSCGCYLREINSTHNLSKHRLYGIWLDIKKRCFDSTRKAYKNYGGRGITVCDEWCSDFMNFYNWAINNGYDKNLTLDRIDNNKNYQPDNCRWVSRLVQNNNTRRNVYVEFRGEILTVSQLARRFNIHPKTISYRLRHGYKGEELIAKPNSIRKRKGK